jgi:large subunit ribosomal protein L34e
MPQPRFRARTFRRVHVKTPGGRNVIHYEKRKNSAGTCGICGKPLNRARMLPSTKKKLSKTAKRPERPYPHLCPSCMREEIKKKARKALQ